MIVAGHDDAADKPSATAGGCELHMLIDLFAPNPDAVEIHSILINAPSQSVYEALWSVDFGDSFIIKFLLGLRSTPEFIANGLRSLPRTQEITLETILNGRFGLVDEKPGDEILLGVTGRFWRPTGNLLPFDRADFDRPVPAGVTRALWSFQLKPTNGKTTLETQTRVICGDSATRRKFLAYWVMVRPFSGLIRLIMLRKVRKAAQDRTVANGQPES